MLELEHTILGQPLPDEHDNNASVEMDVYDTSKSAYVPLAGNLLQEDIVQRMGTRLRMHVRVVSSNSHNNIHNNDTNGIDDNHKPKARGTIIIMMSKIGNKKIVFVGITL